MELIMQVQPYLFFDGHCEEALEFYRSALGAQVGMLLRFSDAPRGGAAPDGCDPMPMPMPADKVMHTEMRVGDTTILCSDGMRQGTPKFDGFSLTLDCTSDAEAARLFDALANGGEVRQSLSKTFFASSFGMLVDRFGVSWMLIHRGDR
jgi:PhnB protein